MFSKLNNFIISFSQFPNKPKDAIEISSYFYKILNGYNFTNEQVESFAVVTDEGQNIKSAFKFKGNFLIFLTNINLENYIFCICHMLNTIAKRTIVPYKKSNLCDIVLENCKRINNSILLLHQFIGSLR